MTFRTLLWRRAPLALAALIITIGVGSGRLGPAASAPQPVSAPVTTTTSTTTSTTAPTTTTAAPVPEPVPEAAPEPAPEPAPARVRAAKPPPQPAAAPQPAPAPQSQPAGTESETAQFISLINQLRANNGLDPLAVAGDATAKAKQQADEMAAAGQMSHSGSMSSGLRGGWIAVGENVGEGGSVGRIESAFEASGTHLGNMLNPGYNQVGVGVSRGGDGRLYVTEVFVGR